ncbi:MAG: apolipoprotein N-acyltransferase [bacterium]|nr:apolipoprotein N-acyltransferase [bacterium]
MGWFLAILSGILAGFAYPARFGTLQFPDLGFLGFFCWVPLMAFLRGRGLKAAFGYSFIAGIFHFAVSQFWLYRALNTFGGLSPTTSIAVLSLLILVLSAYFGLIFWLSAWICKRLGWETLWVRPVVWVGIEYLRHMVPLGGYPWSQLGYTQSDFLAFMQSAEWWGAYGITFILVLINELLALAYAQLRGRKIRLSNPSWILAVVLILFNLGFGLWRMGQPLEQAYSQVKVGVVQGNIPQEDKWQRGKSRRILDKFRLGTHQLEVQGAELILWPEASFPYTIPYDGHRLPISLANKESFVLMGSITRPKTFRGPTKERYVYNSAVLVDPDNYLNDHYHKKKLVPFGEYIPHKDLFWFARKLTAEVGNLQAGQEYHPIEFKGNLLGVLICYEDIFPYISREMVAKGANALVNITNDAWYGHSSAPYQHQAYSQMRAVETRRGLIRATNTGVSSQIDPKGRILWQGGLFTTENFLSELPLYRGETLFVKIGYLLPHFFLIIIGALVIAAYYYGKRT